MEPTEMEKIAAEIVRQYENRPLQDRINCIAATFGCKTANIVTSPCTGKWRGSSDISLALDNGSALFIGNYSTPQAKTVKVQSECVNSALAQYNPEIVSTLKARAVAPLLQREAEDNAIAGQKRLKPYTFLNVELNDGSDPKTGGYLGWYYVTLAVDNKILAFIETSLCHGIAQGNLSDHISNRDYFTAGALHDADVDFVFNNVGHSSFAGLYQLPLTEKARERAEATLADRQRGPKISVLGQLATFKQESKPDIAPEKRTPFSEQML